MSGDEGVDGDAPLEKQSPLRWLKGFVIVASRTVAGLVVIGLGLYVYHGFTDVPTITGVVSYCGTDYYSGTNTGLPLAEVQGRVESEQPSGQTALSQVGRAPWIFGERVYASQSSPGGTCPPRVWVRSGADSYVEFDLPSPPPT